MKQSRKLTDFIFHIKLLVIANLFACTVHAENDMVTQTRKQQHAIRENVMAISNAIFSPSAAAKSPSYEAPSHSTAPDNSDLLAFPDGLRDPFAIPQRLLDNLVSVQALKDAGSGQLNYAFSRQSSNKIPEIKLKGVMRQAGQKSPLAVVMLNNETYMVREKDEIGFNPANPAQVIKIVKIKRLSLLVEVGTLGELVVVR